MGSTLALLASAAMLAQGVEAQARPAGGDLHLLLAGLADSGRFGGAVVIRDSAGLGVRYAAYPASQSVRYAPDADAYLGRSADGRVRMLTLYEDLAGRPDDPAGP